ncbi:UNVERIFIED_CONTAM: hypothetical protein FO527_29495 [Bacillus sp. ATCC 13368]
MLPPLTYQPDHLSGILLACAMGNLILRGASCLDAGYLLLLFTISPTIPLFKTTDVTKTAQKIKSSGRDAFRSVQLAKRTLKHSSPNFKKKNYLL